MADEKPTDQKPDELTRLGFRALRRQLLDAFPDATPANEVIHPRREY